MKLLFDQNISHRLVGRLSDLYPGSEHVRRLGLDRADDRTVWEYASENGFAIVSKDEDFHQLSFLHGAPPKVVWVRLGNCTTGEIEEALRRHHSELVDFDAQDEGAFLVIGPREP